MENLKLTLAAARVNAGMTQSELAAKLGVSKQTVIAWERGQRPIRPIAFHAFADAVGMPEEHLRLPLYEAAR